MITPESEPQGLWPLQPPVVAPYGLLPRLSKALLPSPPDSRGLARTECGSRLREEYDGSYRVMLLLPLLPSVVFPSWRGVDWRRAYYPGTRTRRQNV